jgi:hypothetical protein
VVIIPSQSDLLGTTEEGECREPKTLDVPQQSSIGTFCRPSLTACLLSKGHSIAHKNTSRQNRHSVAPKSDSKSISP